MALHEVAHGPVDVQLVYDFTCVASKSSIDTNVDGPMAALFPTDGRLLEVYMYLRDDEAAVAVGVNITFNNDSGTNYERQLLRGNSGTATATYVSGQTSLGVVCFGANAAANSFSPTTLIIPNYASTVGNKAGTATTSEADSTSDSRVDLSAFNYLSTSALTRIKIAPATGGANLVTGSRLLVYRR